ncbi:hypothetical protein NTE_00380 [Candidatus Nitrososphaera evergladensis SR1]|uniref:Uncharacterized protein n=1 Tax=Candidatus Nitrososphaera evergladensis SR1 TaxID=1459636 RepID=A0A075MNS3_9ARCH|nr:hypothetical protein NTE_00380 [Candidatus Nitrososphaera evergladensis SR1]
MLLKKADVNRLENACAIADTATLKDSIIMGRIHPLSKADDEKQYAAHTITSAFE